jgi:hypothetical protein
MATPTTVNSSSQVSASTVDTARVYQEGIIAGIVGALTVALWFLAVDAVHGRPFYTPTVLGTALFGRGVLPATLDTVAPSLDMVAMFTWVHLLAFAVIGVVVSRLIAMAERNPTLGFGFVLLFVILEACFTAAAMIVAAPVLHALTWPAILVANLLAAAAMAGYFWLRHPTLSMQP